MRVIATASNLKTKKVLLTISETKRNEKIILTDKNGDIVPFISEKSKKISFLVDGRNQYFVISVDKTDFIINIQFLWTPMAETILKNDKRELFQPLSHLVSGKYDIINIPKKFKPAIEEVL